MFHHPVGGHQSQVRFVRRQSRELAAPLLGGRLVETVHDDGMTGFAPGGEPADGGAVVIESVATLDPRATSNDTGT